MNREQLAHIVRAAATVTGDGDIVIIGSQSILGTADAGDRPEEATMSVEADIAFRHDIDARKAGFVAVATVHERADMLDQPAAVVRRVHDLIVRCAAGLTS
jgi:hypothetical protein